LNEPAVVPRHAQEATEPACRAGLRPGGHDLVTPYVQNCLYGLASHVERACIRVAPRLHFHPRFV
jgi:hypothetical protein